MTSLSFPQKSFLVKSEHFRSEWLKKWALELREDPDRYHRKIWEFAVIAEICANHNPARAVGFGVGREPLSCWMASKGIHVLATDLPSSDDKVWDSNQNANSSKDLLRDGVCDPEKFDSLVRFSPVNMNDIPEDLCEQFDFTWSCGSFEHLGSIENGIRFFLESMNCLRPGGIAVHTTEYNFLSNDSTLESRDIVIFRERDLRDLESRLKENGDTLWELDLLRGAEPDDLRIDTFPYRQDHHLCLYVGGHPTTSIVLVAKRGRKTKRKSKKTKVIGASRSKKILWVGDSPTVSTGFAKCTRFACEALHAAGHEIHILGINEFGDPHDYPYKIYPCIAPLDGCHDAFGVGRLPLLIDKISPDLIILLNDPWNIPEYFEHIDWVNEQRIKQGQPPIPIPPVVGWIAVDSKNQKGEGCNRLSHVMVWTEFAGEELISGGYKGDYSIVPLGVDTDIFYPRDREESRAITCPKDLSPDAFIVGVVGRNQPRKRLDLTIKYFASWIHDRDIDNAYLYLYISSTGEKGCDIRSLVKYYGIQGKVISPDLSGAEVSESLMPNIYSSFDVYLSTSQAEGFGLPTLEAAACGVPIIVPDCGGFSSWIPDDCGIKISCPSTALTAPLNSYPYTIGGVADEEATVEAINRLYTFKDERERLSRKGMEMANELSWKSATDKLLRVIEGVMQEQGQEREQEQEHQQVNPEEPSHEQRAISS